MLARLDRLPVWPYAKTVLWIVGVGYLIAFFDITNVAFGLPVFSKLMHLTASQASIPITASLLGYIVGAWINSNLADVIGRKQAILSATLLFTIGCIATTFSFSLWWMIIWRFITGMGIGAEIAAISAYIGELAPASLRGRYTAMANIFSMVGQGLVPIIALILVPNFNWGWRGMFLLGALGVITLFFFAKIPESPRWLLTKDRYEDAKNIIDDAESYVSKKLKGSLPPLVTTADEVQGKGFPTAELLRSPYIGRVILLLVMWFVWYLGCYTWLGMAPTFFVDKGYTLTGSIGFMLAASIGYPVGSILSTWLGDRFERKYTILVGMVVWTVGFLAIAFFSSPSLIYTAVFVLSGSLGFFLPLMYALTSESFPTRARATGVSLTDGIGHLGGAVGPILATSIYAWGGAHGFTSAFVYMGITGFITIVILPFTISATRKPLEVVTSEEIGTSV
ncbi:MFS transporter [Alicyclobacillus fastidiosus]|uniref:MFS transporter n=1 Tax=Alicyclobacillus fastidiosus TaxID=392011 RepID=UPI0024E0F79B|nr:MFS transporter [Alicyclobacillus fastidiosus]